MGAELVLEDRSEGAGLDACRPAGPVDLEDPVEAGHVEGDDPREPGAHVGLDPTDDRGPAAEGDDGDARRAAPVEQGHDVGLVGGAGDQVGRLGQLAPQQPHHVAVGATVGVERSVATVRGAEVGDGVRRRQAGGAQDDGVERHGGNGCRGCDPEPSADGGGQLGDLVVGEGGVLPAPSLPGAGSRAQAGVGGGHVATVPPEDRGHLSGGGRWPRPPTAYPEVVVNLSGTQLVVVLIVTAALAYLGYVLSETDRRSLGRTPWGLPSPAWAVIWFLSPLVGFVLWLFAHRSGVRRAADPSLAHVVAPSPHVAPARASGSDFPAYPRRADGGAPSDGAGSGASAPAEGGAGHTVPVYGTGHPVSPPAWHPDPSGRYHYRWWTGSEWTSYVSVHGHVEVDTSPDQRIGPY